MSLTLHIPRFQRLAETNLHAGFQHANLISLMRALAALEVVAAHLRAQLFPSLKTLPDPTLWYQVLAFFTDDSIEMVRFNGSVFKPDGYIVTVWGVDDAFWHESYAPPNAVKITHWMPLPKFPEVQE